MYQAVAYQKRTNTVHIWDDQKGHVQIKYKPYAYAKNPHGQHVALDGTRLSKVTKFELKSKIEIKNLSYSYKESKTILENISFDINKGDRIGLVGSTGSGKSTLLDIIMGLLVINNFH